MNKWDSLYMDIALRVAEESKCPRKKVGSCILLESGTLATGVNGFPEGQEEQWNDGSVPNPLVIHSELNALGKLLEQGVSAKGATVYVTLSPCIECSKLLVRAKVKRVVYLERYRNTAGLQYLEKYGVIVDKYDNGEMNEESPTQVCSCSIPRSFVSLLDDKTPFAADGTAQEAINRERKDYPIGFSEENRMV